MQKHRLYPSRHRVKIYLAILSGFCVATAAGMLYVQHVRKIPLAADTTLITAPLNTDGIPDYAAVQNQRLSQGVTSTNNAARACFEIVGTHLFFSQKDRERILHALNLPTDPIKGIYVRYITWLFQQIPDPEEAKKRTEELNAKSMDDEKIARTSPWQTSDRPQLAQWLDTQAETIRKTRDAAKLPFFYVPSAPYQFQTDDWDASGANAYQLVQLLHYDAMHAAGEKKLAQLSDDLDAAFRLTLLLYQRPSLDERCSAYSLQSWNWEAVQIFAITPGLLSDNDAANLFKRLRETPSPRDATDIVDTTERYKRLTNVCYAALYGWGDTTARRLTGSASDRDNPHANVNFLRAVALVVPINTRSELEVTNQNLDREIANLRLPSYQQQLTADRALRKSVEPSWKPWWLPQPTAGNVVRGYADNRFFMAKVDASLALTTLALRCYRETHGHFPNSLQTLITDSSSPLKTMPADDFGNGPLHYRTTAAKNEYTLYSVGTNGIDDGGRTQKEAYAVKDYGNYDIVINGK